MNEHDRSIRLLDYLAMVVQWRKFILLNLVAITVIATGVVFLLPKWYKATASILPPRQQDLFSTLSSASSLLKSLPGGGRIPGLTQKSGAYNYMAILNSRSALEAVVIKFDLINVYDARDSSLQEAVKELEDNVKFETLDDETLVITVLDKDPQRSADMANYFVEILNDISLRLGTREARSNREFIERRLDESKADLRKAEDSLRAYQEKSRFLIAPDVNSASMSGIGELVALKAKKEVELSVLRQTTSGDNAAIAQLQIELGAIDKKLQQFPEAGLTSFRLYRDVAIQQKIVEILLPMYEQVKVDEQKDVPVLLVLDKGVRPEKKDRPKRLLIIGLTFLGALILNAIFVFSYESARRSGALAALKQVLRIRQPNQVRD
jgi:uncharacterized protein involved in exopolysaccharide biosynthesis